METGIEHLFPGATKLQLRLTASRTNRRIVGAQVLGDARAEVSKRVDLFAIALHHGMTVDQVSDLDAAAELPLGSRSNGRASVGARQERLKAANKLPAHAAPPFPRSPNALTTGRWAPDVRVYERYDHDQTNDTAVRRR
jgi:hypothetical protein